MCTFTVPHAQDRPRHACSSSCSSRAPSGPDLRRPAATFHGRQPGLRGPGRRPRPTSAVHATSAGGNPGQRDFMARPCPPLRPPTRMACTMKTTTSSHLHCALPRSLPSPALRSLMARPTAISQANLSMKTGTMAATTGSTTQTTSTTDYAEPDASDYAEPCCSQDPPLDRGAAAGGF